MEVGEDAAAENEELEIEEDDIIDILKEFKRRVDEKLANAEVIGNPRN